MRMNADQIQKRASRLKTYWNVANAAIHSSRPLLVQLVVTKRCNLSCGYCYEFDKTSKPVPLDELKKRIDHCKKLKAVFITLNGGEPLLHPHIGELIAYIRQCGMIPMMNSNGWLLTAEKIDILNAVGLYGVQISCDSLLDNEVTRKSMKRLRPKLDLLKAKAEFKVRINGVLGSTPPEEVIAIAKIVLDYDFDFQCSLMRDATGAALPLSEEAKAAYMTIREMRGRLPAILNDSFQLPLVNGNDVKWKCRAGARHFEVDAEGFVHLCQPRTASYSKALLNYTHDDIKHHFYTEKPCAAKCPIAYAHLGSRMDQYKHQNLISHV